MAFFSDPIDFDNISLPEFKTYAGQRVEYNYGEKEADDSFCGLYFHGSMKPFTLEEHDIPSAAFVSSPRRAIRSTCSTMSRVVARLRKFCVGMTTFVLCLLNGPCSPLRITTSS